MRHKPFYTWQDFQFSVVYYC